MFIAQELAKTNATEYLLYMWQVEDVIRAAKWDIETIKSYVLTIYKTTPQQESELLQWYSDLIQMMREEGVTEQGHLQLCHNVLIRLTDLHRTLLESPQYPFYSAAYYKALPYIVELRAKSGKEEHELVACFEALYGVMLLRLQKKEINEETTRGVEAITQMISLLAKYYHSPAKDEA